MIVPLVFLVVVALFMIVEAAISARHERALRAVGSIEPSDDLYRWIAAAYPTFFVAIAIEGMVRGAPDRWQIICGGAVFALAKVVKFWAIASLGIRWTFRVLVPPGSARVIRGPYRFVTHPNYLAVVGEFLGMSIACGSPLTGTVAILGFGLLMLRRITIEERALAEALTHSSAQDAPSGTRASSG